MYGLACAVSITGNVYANSPKTVEGVLIVGAGEAGNMIVREIKANPQLQDKPIAFIDDDPTKLGKEIQNLAVLGTSDDIPKIVAQHNIERIIVAVPFCIPHTASRNNHLSVDKRVFLQIACQASMKSWLGHKTISRFPQLNPQSIAPARASCNVITQKLPHR